MLFNKELTCEVTMNKHILYFYLPNLMYKFYNIIQRIMESNSSAQSYFVNQYFTISDPNLLLDVTRVKWHYKLGLSGLKIVSHPNPLPGEEGALLYSSHKEKGGRNGVRRNYRKYCSMEACKILTGHY